MHCIFALGACVAKGPLAFAYRPWKKARAVETMYARSKLDLNRL